MLLIASKNLMAPMWCHQNLKHKLDSICLPNREKSKKLNSKILTQTLSVGLNAPLKKQISPLCDIRPKLEKNCPNEDCKCKSS